MNQKQQTPARGRHIGRLFEDSGGDVVRLAEPLKDGVVFDRLRAFCVHGEDGKARKRLS
ncbi:hypothetical protein D3C86_2264280 [compost metagenome]